MDSILELNQLRYFLDVADTEHMTQSAKRLHIVQPALTRSIHRLEDELGVELFAHEGRNIRLTSYGRHLKERAQPLFEQLEGLEDDMRRFSDERQHSVHINIASGSNLMIDTIIAYRREHPEAEFHITQRFDPGHGDISTYTMLPDELAKRKGALVATGSQSATELHLSEDILLAVPKDSSYHGIVEPEELDGSNLIRLAGSRILRQVCDQLCEKHHVRPVVAFESDSPSVVQKIIGLGMGVGFWPERSWPQIDPEYARLVPISARDFRRMLVVTLNDSATATSEAKQFFEFCREKISS